MTQRMTPGRTLEFASLSDDPKVRHEQLVDLFGQYMMWMRNVTIDAARKLVTSAEARDVVGRIMRHPYEEAALMSREDQERALHLAETTVDGFIDEFLRLLAHKGFDFRMGREHAVRYRLEMEIVDHDSEEIIQEEVINRNGDKFFADYWGRWLNRHKDEGRHVESPPLHRTNP